MYQMTGDASLNCPPHLMEIVTEWVFSKPSLALMSAIASPKHSATPIPGLIHWCVMAPVARVAADDGSADDSAAAQTLFSRLHLGVLQTMLRGQEIGMRHVILCEHFEHSLATLAAIPRDSVDAESLNMSLNRLGQALQVAKTTGLLSGDIAELVASTAALPHNRLLDIVLRDS
ncbi:PREDICTED: uncharacterized protein C7orf26 homolog [Priapulus caudatus]|uniref:Uncharacterized protein C7orf26 homolog n=1 Tax=Priapulus caudatus TaxID=37621 RepID=A0ABM1ENQ5_PRICU|nr:PREDICTED: uncharacterized protein C7orf26 homolog [Priapulus caudatus]